MVIPNLSLTGKVALITGGRRGIGRAIALAYAEAGADVAVCDLILNDRELQTLSETIQNLGRHFLAVQADTSQKKDVDNMVVKIIEQFGTIDILINNAAIGPRGKLMDTSENDWDQMININLKGYFLCSQAVAKNMIVQKRGCIINMASQASFRADAELGTYCISKAGVVMFTHVLARELGNYQIRVNAIGPGMVRTEMSRELWEDSTFIKQLEDSVPLGRIAETSDIAGTALFLASDISSHITGQTILVDGGEIA